MEKNIDATNISTHIPTPASKKAGFMIISSRFSPFLSMIKMDMKVSINRTVFVFSALL